jgi:hypothetical protein
LLPGGHAIYKLLDVNAVVRTGRIFCSGASNSSAPSVPPSDKPFSFVATEAQLDGFTSTVTDMALAVPTLHRSLRVPVLSHDNLDYCERGSVSSYKIAGIDNTLHTAPMDRPPEVVFCKARSGRCCCFCLQGMLRCHHRDMLAACGRPNRLSRPLHVRVRVTEQNPEPGTELVSCCLCLP